jgi:hypothetical protein
MKWLGSILAAVIVPLLLSEFTDWCPWFARRLVGRAVRRLPEASRDRWEEEWLGDLAAFEGRRLSILARGLWIYLRAPSWGRMLQGRPPLLSVLISRIKALAGLARRRRNPVAKIYIENLSEESMKGARIHGDRLRTLLEATNATSVKIGAVPKGDEGVHLVVGADNDGNPLAITSWVSERRFRRTWTWRAPS